MVISHFGTAREPWIAMRLAAVLPPLLRARPEVTFLLLGRTALEMRSRLLAVAAILHACVCASGPLAPEDVSRHLGACDVMLQPYGVASAHDARP